MTYKQTLLVPKASLKEINSYLSGKTSYGVPYTGVISYRVVFEDGFKAEAILSGDGKNAVAYARLISKNDTVVYVSDIRNIFVTTYELPCGRNTYILEVKENTEKFIFISKKYITQKQLRDAEQCLIDNGIDDDETMNILQALGYILLDTELYPED